MLFANCSLTCMKYAADSSMASPTSANGEYDPKIDPARKPRRSTDPGWKYAYWPDLENKDKVECLLCGDDFRGG